MLSSLSNAPWTRNQLSILPLAAKPIQNQYSLRRLTLPHGARLEPLKVSASSLESQSPILDAENDADFQPREKLKVAVKPIERPRLVLKFIWMDKNIGIAINQYIPGGNGTIPLSPYYFWPRKDAWEELKVMLESKPWISNKQMVILLNQATDIINLWQQSNGD